MYEYIMNAIYNENNNKDYSILINKHFFSEYLFIDLHDSERNKIGWSLKISPGKKI